MTFEKEVARLRQALKDLERGRNNSIFIAAVEKELSPLLADAVIVNNEGDAWSSPREYRETTGRAEYPHGMVDLIRDEGWARVWVNKGSEWGWRNTHRTISVANP